jgi:hypothetical protein
MNNLAIVLDCQGKYRAAEEMHRWTLNEKVLGLEHANTLTSMNNLAECLTVKEITTRPRNAPTDTRVEEKMADLGVDTRTEVITSIG